MTRTLYSGGGFSVTNTSLQTPRQTFALTNIEHISVRKPLLFLAGFVSLGMLGFCLSFFRYLYPSEILTLIVVAAILFLAALRVGTLKVHSLALRDDDGRIFGDIRQLNAVKAAVEQAMENRLTSGGP